MACIQQPYYQPGTVQPPGITPQFPQRVSDIQNFVSDYGEVLDKRFDNPMIPRCTTGINIIKNSSEISFAPDRENIEYNPVPPIVNVRPNRSGADTMAPARRNDGMPPDSLPDVSIIEPEEL